MVSNARTTLLYHVATVHCGARCRPRYRGGRSMVLIGALPCSVRPSDGHNGPGLPRARHADPDGQSSSPS